MLIVRSNRLPRWLHLPAIALIFTAVLAATVSAQSLGALDRQRGHIMLEAVRKDLERNYYDTSFGGVDLSPRWTEANQQIELATTLDQILGAIAQVPLSLGDSHTLFFPPARTLNAEYGWEMQMIGDTCYVSRVNQKSDAARQGVRPGDVVLMLNGNRPDRQNISLVRYVLQVLAPQPVLRVRLQSPGGKQRELILAARVRRRPFIMDLTGLDGGRDLSALLRDINNEERKWIHRYVEVGRDVMVWEMPTFSWSADIVRRMFGKMRGRRALVLDLRGNPGGTEKTMLEMIGGFYAGDTPVATLRNRADSSLLVARGRGDKQFEGKGHGLVPDEVILPTAEDLAAGRDPALRRALALVGVDVSAEAAGKMFPDRRGENQ